MLSNVPMVRAGDVLLICFAKEQTEASTRRFTEQVQECLPGVRVAVVEGVTGLAVFRPEESCSYPTINAAGE